MDWIEKLLHVSPDRGNGAVEFVIYLLVVTVVAIGTTDGFAGRRRRA